LAACGFPDRTRAGTGWDRPLHGVCEAPRPTNGESQGSKLSVGDDVRERFCQCDDLYPLTHLSPQCALGHVEPSRISNKKYDAELLHPVTKSALQAQGISEAYTWLEACVAESDIAVGRPLESAQAQGTLGRLHEVGAGRRVAAVYVMEPCIHLGDSNRFWSLPADALPPPVQQDYARPLPRVRYKEPQKVPIALVASVPDDSDDERPLVPLKRPRRKALLKGKRSGRKRQKAK
jgi:hypothetical protein